MSVSNQEPLAIVGIGCRLPGGSNDPESFWKLLSEGRSGIREVPEDRWDIDRYYSPDVAVPVKMITKWGGFVDEVDQFDASFFGISPREAQRMDPQQRWLLEVSWEALEDAGQKPAEWRGSNTGVFVGIASNDYASVQMMEPESVDVHTNSGSTLSIASNRISYLYDFKGPAVSVDTACSSALVAINMACKSIWSGDCEAAIAGGVNALIMPDTSIGFSKATMLSPSGQCFAFDARANGYVRGEGAGMIVVKPLAKAQEDGDRIYSVIRAAVVNQDGNTSSMTVPGEDTQAEMLRIAYKQAGMPASRVTYMEAHGTGTPVGDPIETRALGAVLCEGRPAGEPCIIGSVKANIGHLESGSGIAGLIKAAMTLHKGEIPRNINYETPNPNIPFDDLKLKVPTENMPMPRQGDHPPVAAVNSFGFGGTNAHIVLEEAPAPLATERKEAPVVRADRPQVLPLSGNGDAALQNTAEVYREFLNQGDHPLADVAYSAGTYRQHHADRLVVFGDNAAEMRSRLKGWMLNPTDTPAVVSGEPTVKNAAPVFVFTGQGAQWWGMGQGLLETEPVFRHVIEDIDRLVKPLTGWSLREEMTRSEEDSNINRTDIAQPAIFALQVALAELWKSWGVIPEKVVGHSVGEVAAAYVAGAYTMEDAVKVICHRSRLQNTTGGKGRMVAVGLSQIEAKALLRSHGVEETVQVAVVNSPGMVTIAGDTEPLEKVVAELEEKKVFLRWLRIDYAFHTHQMEPIKDELLEALADIQPRPTTIPYYSTVTGGLLEGEALDAHYWWRNVRESVLFAPAIKKLAIEGSELFLELGPHPALANPVTECLGDVNRKGTVLHSLKRKDDETLTILRNLAALHIEGADVDWAAVNQTAGERVLLPKYAWNHERFWIEGAKSKLHRFGKIDHPLLGVRQATPDPTWEFRLDPRDFKYLDDHRVWDSIIFPAAGYAEMGLAAARMLFPDEPIAVEELVTQKALFVAENKVPVCRVVYREADKSFAVFSTTNAGQDWEQNAEGFLRKVPAEAPADYESRESICSRMEKHATHEEYYEDYEAAGYQFGPNFCQLQNVWSKPHESIAEIVVPEEIIESAPNYHFQPSVLDACFHALKGAQIVPDNARKGENFYLPAAIRRVHLYADRAPNKLWAHALVTFDNRESVICDIIVFDEEGTRVADILGFRVDRAAQKDEDAEALDASFYQFEWEPVRLRGSRTEGDIAFPDTDKLVAAASDGIGEIFERHRLNIFNGVYGDEVETLAALAVEEAYAALGWQPTVGDVFSTETLIRDLGIVPEHHRLAVAQLQALSRFGTIERLGDVTWKVQREPRRTDVRQGLRDLRERFPDYPADCDLFDMAWPALADVLIGESDPLEVLFPGGSSEKLEAFYIGGGDFPANNEMLAAAVAKAVASIPARRAVRILEIGAGTGSLTRSVLDAIPNDRIDYTFTDNGPGFIAEARKAFADRSCMDFAVFDIEEDPAGQGIDVESYDLILATNVVHATSDLRNTLHNVKRCLSDGGVLMFLEVTLQKLALDLVFGLLKGWWQYTDTDLRPESALLPPDRWLSLLSDCGYEAPRCFHAVPDDFGKPPMQSVFVTGRGAAAEPAEAPEADGAPAEAAAEDAEVEEIAEAVLLFEDGTGLADQLADKFTAAGDIVVRARTTEDPAKLLSEIKNLKLIVHSATLDCGAVNLADGPSDLAVDQREGSLHMLALSHALAARADELEEAYKPQVVFVTRGVFDVTDGDQVDGLSSAPLVGMMRVARGEHGDFGWLHLDLAGDSSAYDADEVFDEIAFADGEAEISYRDGRRHANRLHPIKSEEQPDRSRDAIRPDGSVLPYRLQISTPGILTNLALHETPREDPGEGEIEVSMKAGGINFRDVMKALGMYPGNPVDVKWFGDDFAGIVTRVGPGVTDLKPGDEVVGMAPYCFRSYVRVHRHMVFKKAAHQSFEEASTLPTVFLTAHYALEELAKMQKGERVLIHAGTGGVGMAAIQIAKGLGLEIFATAGSPEKRKLLLELGADHALNSRTLEFADEVMRLTNGEGVDMVLNSLAGDFIPKSFSVLRTFGRFVEIGKIDIYGNSKLGLEQLRNNISYFVVDLAQHLQDKPEFVARMFGELAERFHAGDYKPLPHKSFPVTEVVEAFRYMAQGKHVGKNVLNFDLPSIPVAPCTQEGHLFNNDASYLVTGGMGGFGFELAKWMAKNGARNLVLMSRSGARDESIIADIEKMAADGITIVDARGDVTSQADIEGIVEGISTNLPPLKGVIHGAMVIDDQFMVDIDEHCLTKVLHPKMLGAWNLHKATLDCDLDHFVCFSSFSAVIGAVKQANYNAGNYFLDAIAHHRQARGLPALTVNWGALSGAGFVERNEKTAAYLDKLGMKTYTMADTQEVMARFLPKTTTRVAASVVDWQQIVKLYPSIKSQKTYAIVAARSGEGEGGGSVRPQVLAAAPEDRLGILEDFIAAQVAGVFGTDVSKIDRDTPLTNIGLDSLMAIELMNRMESALGLNLPMGTVLNGPNIRELAANLLEQILASDDGATAAEGVATGASVGGLLPAVEKSGLELDEFPLSEGQKALWFLHQLSPDSAAYNLVFCSKITPLLDMEVMKQAFASLFERHPMLDATFHVVDGEPIQRLRRGGTIDFREHDASGLSEDGIKAALAQHAEKPFDLENGPLVRMELFKTNDDAHVVLLSMHHIVSDAWSVSILMNDLIESYFSMKSGIDPDYSPLEYRYHDYVDWQQRNLAGEFGEQAGAYWADHLAGAPTALDLPIDHPRPAVQTFNGSRHGFELDRDLATRVLALAADQNATVYATMLSAFNVLFHRYCGQDDMVVGSPMAGRNQGELGGIIGYFINPVPLRSTVDDNPTFAEFVQRTGASAISAIEHQDYPLVKIVDDLKTPRDPARSPLFQVSFAMERVPGVDEQGIAVFLIGKGGHQFEVGDLTVETVDLNMRQAQFEITLVVEESDGRLFGCWQYNRDLFDAATIERMNDLFSRVLDQVTENPELRISDVDLLSDTEARKVLVDWNDTAADYPQDKGLHALVSEQAIKTPDAEAIHADGRTLTYAQLDGRSNAVAAELLEKGAGKETTVALLADRSPEMVVAMLGILKAGAHYIPMDPDYPDYRLRQMLDDAKPAFLMVGSALSAESPQGSWQSIIIEDCADSHAAVSAPAFSSDQLAYVIYTSGSTGLPKGVEISHAAAENFLTSMRRQPGMTRVDKLLAVTTLSFDISLLEIFLPLISGAQVVIASREEARDGRHLARLLDEHHISVMQATPATWRMLLDSGWEGRNGLKVLCGGEPMPRDLASLLINSADEVWNLYGPTETTVWSTVSKITAAEGIIDIGKPIANTEVYILDERNNVMPPGFVGELCIGGVGLARGYRDRPEQTAERFPTVDLPGVGERRLYRTGDLARWRVDGELECLGRIDFQIKLRGVRMELGEIENALMQHDSVSEAVVTKREDLPGGEALVAYLVNAPDAAPIKVADLKHHLTDRLPEAMRPSFYEVLAELPLTPNRKVDRKRLPAPAIDRSDLETEFVAPSSESEAALAQIFNDAFDPLEVGVRDNFFELGGDSLLAVKIVTRISEKFGQEVRLDAFMRYPTIEQLARHLHTPVASAGAGETASAASLSSSMPSGEMPDMDYLSMQLVEDGDESSLPKVDAVALAYIPDAFAAAAGMSRKDLVEKWFDSRARLGNTYETPWGMVGVVLLPFFEADLYREDNGLKAATLDAMRLAARLGARTVSLTGAIPMATNGGRDIVTWMNGEGVNLPIITTGDATRTATVVKSVEGMLDKAGAKLADQRVAFVGLGSIGQGTLDLILEVLPHPKAVTLCDFYQTDERLVGIQDQLLASGYEGEITIAAANGSIPDSVYEADLIIAATSVPGAISVEKLKAGTMLVDYSFPAAFSTVDAARRSIEHGDILFSTGGQLRLRDDIDETIFLPAAATELVENIGPEKISALAGRDGREMTGCVLASVFTGMEPDVRVTLGALSGEDALAHYRFIDGLGIEPARLQMEGYFLDDETVKRFRNRPNSERSEISG